MSFETENGFRVLKGDQITTTSDGGPFQPGEEVIHKGGSNFAQRAKCQWVRLNNNGCSQGEVLVADLGTTVGYGVAKAATTDEGAPMRGIAAATIASNDYGFMIYAGWCEKADLSHTAASGEYLCISGSTAGKLTPNKASVFNLGTQGNASQLGVVAVARTAIATGVGSVQILSYWG